MKSTLTQKVIQTPDCRETGNPTLLKWLMQLSRESQAVNENARWVRRYAAMVGLAFSMSAGGMLWTSHNKPVMAATSPDANSAITNLSTSSSADGQYGTSSVPQSSATKETTVATQLASPTLKHEVKEGESLWTLAKDYQINPQTIADSNQISPKATLKVGQTLKIPSFAETQAARPLPLSAKLPSSSEETTQSLNTSRDHLRETRKRLQESITELKVEATATTRDVADVSQPLTSSVKTALSGDISQVQEIEREKETQQLLSELKADAPISFEQPIPIAVPTPETDSQSTPIPIPVTATTPVSSSKNQENTEDNYSESSESSPEVALSQPIAIPVIPSDEPEQGYRTLPSVIQGTSSTSPTGITVPQPTMTRPTVNERYQVQVGDTLNSIARHHGISVRELSRANGITNPNLIKINQTLVIPQKNPSPSPLADLPFPNPQPSSVTATTPKTLVHPSALAHEDQPTTLEIAVNPTNEAYTNQLRADVAELQRDYPSDLAQTTFPAQEVANETVVGEAINPEWLKDRLNGSSGDNHSESTDIQVAQGLPPSRSSGSHLIGAVTTNETAYNSPFQIPIGETVGPQLPNLSRPDDYLPDAPMRFTGHIWPTKGVITSGYGRRWGRMHKGIDIAAPIGTPIVASAPGEVVSAGWNSGGYGNLVKVRHSDGSLTLYAHNSRILVRRGQQVNQGELIAEMGSTGYSTGPHLHYEIHPSGQGARNPMAFLPKRG